MKNIKKYVLATVITLAAAFLLTAVIVFALSMITARYTGPEVPPFETVSLDLELSDLSDAQTLEEITETETEPETETQPETTVQTEPVTQTEAQVVQTEWETTAEPLPVIVPDYRVVEALGEDTVNYLMSLDNTCRGWGQGVNLDEKNRPTGALNAQNAYGGFGSYYIMDDSMKMYLTFDEGYENGYTPLILDTLKAKGVSAVFFVTLHYAKNNPDLIWRMINEGHVLGNHSAYHGSLPGESLEDAYDEVKILHDYIYDNFGYTMNLFRFPAGESSDRTQALLDVMGYRSLFWSYAYKDWDTSAQLNPDSALKKLTDAAHPGAIILLHAVSSTNTQILGELIDNYRSMGYELARFD